MAMRLRSFVRRGGRGTDSQARAQDVLGPAMCLQVANGLIELGRDFGRIAPCHLEIGFGTGKSFVAIAKQHPEINFIGIETYKAGIGAVLLACAEEGLTNVRVYDADAIDVLEKCIANNSLAGAQIFFPDPWQKRRHHARRLIQPEFVRLLTEKLRADAFLHLATDWDDYAVHMMQMMSQAVGLENAAGVGKYSARSPQRPVVTKFEGRAVREGRTIHELQFVKRLSSRA